MLINKIKKQKGFTLIELLVVISVIALLTSILLVGLQKGRQKSQRTAAFADSRQLIKAIEFYYIDMGFYPPNEIRGWDPGLARPLPVNMVNPLQDCNLDEASCVCGVYLTCSIGNVLQAGIPDDWLIQAKNKWKGPYIKRWPLYSPWGHYYSYNFWDVPTLRNGCTVPPGIYLGIQIGAVGQYNLPSHVEQALFDEGTDNDGCPQNGEAQMLLIKL